MEIIQPKEEHIFPRHVGAEIIGKIFPEWSQHSASLITVTKALCPLGLNPSSCSPGLYCPLTYSHTRENYAAQRAVLCKNVYQHRKMHTKSIVEARAEARGALGCRAEAGGALGYRAEARGALGCRADAVVRRGTTCSGTLSSWKRGSLT